MTTTQFLIGEAAVLALFAWSLFLPAFRFAENRPVKGLELLLWGWWGLLMFNAGWLANPLALYAGVLVALGNWSRARMVAGMALLCACHSFAVKQYYFDESAATPVKRFGPAVYIWLTSIALQYVLTLAGESQ